MDIKYPFMWAPAAVPSANHLWIIQRPTPTSTQFRIVTSDQLFVLDGFVNLGSNALQQHTYLSLLDPTSAYQQVILFLFSLLSLYYFCFACVNLF